jgi:aconitate hydratase
LRVVIARGFARIHHRNLVSFGVLPLQVEASTYDALEPGDHLRFEGLHRALHAGDDVSAVAEGRKITLRHGLSRSQVDTILAGGAIPRRRARHIPAERLSAS